MKPGSDTWKWALVAVLLAVFITTANQAYVHVTSQEDYAPPDDYLKGDSWDAEHSAGPGAGQPVQMDNDSGSSPVDEAQSSPKVKTDLKHQDNIDWDNVRNPSAD